MLLTEAMAWSEQTLLFDDEPKEIAAVEKDARTQS